MKGKEPGVKHWRTCLRSPWRKDSIYLFLGALPLKEQEGLKQEGLGMSQQICGLSSALKATALVLCAEF